MSIAICSVASFIVSLFIPHILQLLVWNISACSIFVFVMFCVCINVDDFSMLPVCF